MERPSARRWQGHSLCGGLRGAAGRSWHEGWNPDSPIAPGGSRDPGFHAGDRTRRLRPQKYCPEEKADVRAGKRRSLKRW